MEILSDFGFTYCPVDSSCPKWADTLEGFVQSSTTPKQLASQQRHIFVHELLGDRFSMYNNFMEANRFLDDGYYNSALGDAMPLALATALHAHIIFPIEHQAQQMCITPEIEPLCS